MSRNILVTFGGKAYDEQTERTVRDGPALGGCEVWVYDDAWLKRSGFHKLNHWLWETPVQFGFGWCSWKAFIILDAFKRLADGDVVFYLDADTYPVADFRCVFDWTRANDVMLFEAQGLGNRRWIKRDTYMAMAMDAPQYYDAQHGCGRFAGFRRGSFLAEQFLAEWWAYSINPRCQLWDKSIMGPDIVENLPGTDNTGFWQGRCEQAVLSLLGHKYGIPFHREACQWGETGSDKDRDLYPHALFHQEGATGDRRDTSGSRFANIP